MTVTGKLKIILQANETEVAISENPKLWQKVLLAINNDSYQLTTEKQLQPESNMSSQDELQDELHDKLQFFAEEIRVPLDNLKGACSPSLEPPYIYLDKHHWEALKKATPQRDRNSISSSIVAITLLILWKDIAGLGDTKLIEAQKVLDTLGLIDFHARRSISNCEWLQIRGDKVKINPAHTSKGILLSNAFCLKEYPIKKEL